MGWLRLVGSFKLDVSFAEHSLFYRALSQKRPVISRSLLIIASPYQLVAKCWRENQTRNGVKKNLHAYTYESACPQMLAPKIKKKLCAMLAQRMKKNLYVYTCLLSCHQMLVRKNWKRNCARCWREKLKRNSPVYQLAIRCWCEE